MLGFVLVATFIGSHQSTRHTESAHSVAIGVRRLRPTANASISFIVGDLQRPSGLKSEEPQNENSKDQFSGSQSRTRTCNLAINSRLLCQLSYLGMHPRAKQH